MMALVSTSRSASAAPVSEAQAEGTCSRRGQSFSTTRMSALAGLGGQASALVAAAPLMRESQRVVSESQKRMEEEMRVSSRHTAPQSSAGARAPEEARACASRALSAAAGTLTRAKSAASAASVSVAPRTAMRRPRPSARATRASRPRGEPSPRTRRAPPSRRGLVAATRLGSRDPALRCAAQCTHTLRKASAPASCARATS
mmetsp:Transcript_19795/g.53340  ORF Transcript_19795/g.53340 Transcript_19795/m.53340 type:complete len:202 (-) Transcript_19795:94-699(-)